MQAVWPPFPPEVTQGLTFDQGYSLWMGFRDAIADEQLRQQFKPKLMCELFLLHQHPGPVSAEKLQQVHHFFRTQNNRRYANLSTEHKVAKLQERESLLKQVAEQKLQLKAAKLAQRDAEDRAMVNTQAAMLYARAADAAQTRMLYGGDFCLRALAAFRALPHCEATSRSLERFDSGYDPRVVGGEDLIGIVDITHEDFTLDF